MLVIDEVFLYYHGVQLVIKLDHSVNYFVGDDFQVFGPSINYNGKSRKPDKEPESAALKNPAPQHGMDLLGAANMILLLLNLILLTFLLKKRKTLQRDLTLEYSYQPPTAPIGDESQ